MRALVCLLSLWIPATFVVTQAEAKPVQKSDPKIDFALLSAAATGDTMAVRRINPTGHRLEVRDGQNGFTPLMWASWRAQIGTMRELIKRGAQANAKSQFHGASSGVPNIVLRPSNQRSAAGIPFNLFVRNQGVTPLMLAAASGSGMAMQELLAAGADVTARTLSQESALDMASFSGSLTGVKALLDKGATLNDSTIAGYSPLVFATLEGHTPIVKLLLAHGADATPSFFGGITLANLASGAGFSDIAAMLKTAERKQVEHQKKAKRNQAKAPVKKSTSSKTVKIINSDGSVEIVR